MTRKRIRRFEQLESRQLLAAAVINEILYDQLFSSDNSKSQYIELRGEPGQAMESGSYLLTVESADSLNNAEGKIKGIFDLSGIAFGNNGFLVLLPQGSPFQPHPAANVLRSTSKGFGGLPGGIYTDSDPLSDSIPANGSTTYFLIQTAVVPQLGDDIDTNSDGFVDEGGIFDNWNVLDSITVNYQLTDGYGYGNIVFAATDSVLNPNITAKPGTAIVRPDGDGYVGRIGNSTGSAATDWVGGTVKDLNGDEYFVRLGGDIHGRPVPLVLHGRELDSVGSENFTGAARLQFFEDANNNGVFDVGDSPLEGATVFADTNGNGVRDKISTVIEPDNFVDGRELTNLTDGVTLSNTNADNVVIGFKVRAEQVSGKPDGYHVFSSEGIDWFSSSSKLRMDFYRPASSVSIDVIGDSDLTDTYGRLEAYDANGNLLQMVRGFALKADVRQTLTITRPTDEIAYALAFSDDDFLNSSPFGAFDRIQFQVPEASATAGSDGIATLNYLEPDTYTIFADTSVLDDYVFNRPSFQINKYENFDFSVPAIINEPPVFNEFTLTVAEGAAAGTIVGTVAATDHPSQKVSYSLVSGADKFLIDANTGVLRVRQGALLNFETQPSITIQVRATDNAKNPLSTTESFTVSVTDVNETPNLGNSLFEVVENIESGAVIGKLTATDVDAGDNGRLGYRLTGTIPGQAVSINGSTGELIVNNSSYFNYEQRTQFVVTVQAFDAGQPSLSDTATITIVLQDVNETPTVSTGELAVGELAAEGTLVGKIQVLDPDSGQFHVFQWGDGFTSNEFTIDENSGEIFVAPDAVFSFANQSEYFVDVKATDSGFPALSTTKSVRIRLIDQNNPPQILDTELAINENATSGSLVGTIMVSDEDVGQSHVYGIGTSPGQSLFDIDRNSGEITVKEGAELDFESQSTWELLVQAWDTGFPSASSTRIFTVVVNDVNESPVIESEWQLSIAENSGLLSELGVVEFSDPDLDDAPVISIVSGNDDNRFDIDPQSGLVTVIDGASLDFETTSQYVLGLEVTDGTNQPVAALLTITIEDVNEAPIITGQPDPLETMASNSFELALPLNIVADPDAGQTLTWTLAGSQAELPEWLSFDSETGVVSGLPWNADAAVYDLVLTATDSGTPPLSVEIPLTLEVTFNESPWSNPNENADVDANGSVSAVDALAIINYLNRSATTTVDPLVNFRPAYYDVSGNNNIEPLDALIVINFINRNGGSGEGEAAAGASDELLAAPASPFGVNSTAVSQVDELDDRRRQRAIDQALLELLSVG